MKINFHSSKNQTIAEIFSENILVHDIQDAIDLMADCRYQGAEAMILRMENLPAEFFDLKTGFAGEVLQKFSNYRFRLAIVGDFSNLSSRSLNSFIYESNRLGKVIFAGSTEEAMKALNQEFCKM